MVQAYLSIFQQVESLGRHHGDVRLDDDSTRPTPVPYHGFQISQRPLTVRVVPIAKKLDLQIPRMSRPVTSSLALVARVASERYLANHNYS